MHHYRRAPTKSLQCKPQRLSPTCAASPVLPFTSLTMALRATRLNTSTMQPAHPQTVTGKPTQTTHGTSCGHIFIKRVGRAKRALARGGTEPPAQKRSCRRKEAVAVEVGRGYLGWLFSPLPFPGLGSHAVPQELRCKCHQPQMGQERHPGTSCSHHQPTRNRSFGTSEEPGKAENMVSFPMASHQ